eukprot:m.240521 g.240521  ORF g.240521 m.240521 type:complete len:562 (+) comp16082_c0_seq8:99-1784(+)
MDQARTPWESIWILEYFIYGCISLYGWSCIFNSIHEESNDFEVSNVARQGLQSGWLPWTTRKMDLKDLQYRMFRQNIPLLCKVALLSISAKLILSKFGTDCLDWSARERLRWKTRFYGIFTFLFILILHGPNILHIFWILGVNYWISEVCASKDGSRFGIAASWAFSCCLILWVAWRHGFEDFQFKSLPLVGPVLGIVDALPVLTAWHDRFPLIMLRMLSFNMDRHWASVSSKQDIPIKTEKSEKEMATQSYKNPEDYNFVWYLIYVCYPPLYIAGPIITFNSFLSSLKGDGVQFSLLQKLLYGARALNCLFLYEVFIHYFYIGAIAQTGWYTHFFANPLRCLQFGLMAVLFLYLKFLCIWRFFRAWALFDDIYPPENMPQCIIATTGVATFWKGWHSSFNKWLVRYVYIPLGGSFKGAKNGVLNVFRRVVNVAVVFTFVAVWHDQTLSLLAWGWLLVICFTPELIVKYYFGLEKYKHFRKTVWYRHLEALGSVLVIVELILANVIGFSTGLKGASKLAIASASSENISAMVSTVIFLFASAQISHEIRRRQASKNRDHKA